MGIKSKHFYRFVYLRSEEWKDVRFEALARAGAKCRICSLEDFSNDAHHIFYPSSIWDTMADDLVILCRPCHELAQALFVQQADRETGKRMFNAIVGIISEWAKAKRDWIATAPKVNAERSFNPAGCHACGTVSLDNRGFEFFAEIPNRLNKCSFVLKLCPMCIEDAKNNLVLDSPELEGGKLNGFAFRAIRLWRESRRPKGT